jgi:hypothetical protein
MYAWFKSPLSALQSSKLPLLVLVIAVLSLGACGKGGANEKQLEAVSVSSNEIKAQAPSGLGSPLEMLKQVSGGPEDTDRLKGYNYYEASLPQARVDTTGVFSPVGSGGPDRLDEAAYCIYRFEELDYFETPQQFLFGWNVGPAPGKLLVGLSDFTRNSWRWFAPDDVTKLSLPSFEPYISAGGSTLVVVMVMGSEQAKISYLIGGGSVITTLSISANLNFDLSKNVAPLAVDFTAYSAVYAGTVTNFEWDFEDDGTFDVSGPLGEASHTYTDPGKYTVLLQATCDDGSQEQASFTFTVVDPLNTAPTAALEVSPQIADGPASITLDASGSSDPDGQIIKYEWDFNNDGVYDYDSAQLSVIQHNFARKGINFFRVKVTDNDYGSDDYLGAVTLNGGWASSTVSSGYDYIERISASTCGLNAAERPCIAFHKTYQTDLFFVRASEADGSDWDPVQAPIDNSDVAGFSPSLLRSSLTGNPLLFYGSYDDWNSKHALHLVKATNAAGTAWSLPIDIETQLSVGSQLVAFMQNGVPAVLSWSDSQGHYPEVYYYKAGDGTAADWNTRSLAATAPEGSYFTSLAGCGGQEPLALMVYDSNQYGFAHALDPAGTAWQDYQPIENLHVPQICAANVNGKPALAAIKGSKLLFLRADTAAGDIWGGEPVEIEAPKPPYPACLEVIGGKPALAWISGNGDGLYLAQALDPDGAVWGEPFAIVTQTGLGKAIDMVECQGNPVVVYSNDEDDTIEAAHFVSFP